MDDSIKCMMECMTGMMVGWMSGDRKSVIVNAEWIRECTCE
jgi:hypothetical protein